MTNRRRLKALAGRWGCMLLGIGALAGCAGVLGGVSREARDHYDRAVAFYSRGRYQDAIEEYQLALYDSPGMVEAHFGLGVAYLKTGFFRGAVLALNEAVALQAHYPQAYYNLGLAHFNLKKYEAALAAFEQALAQAPDFPDAAYARAQAYEAMDRADEAIRAYERLAGRVAGAHGNLGRLYRLAGDPDRAAEHYLAAAREDSGAFEPRYRLGEIYEEQGRYGEAIAFYRAARALREDVEVLQGLARSFYLDGQPAEAAAVYRAVVLRQPDNARAYYNLGLAYDALEERAEAIAAYAEAARLQPDFADAHLNLGIDLLAEKRYREALAACERFLALSEDSSRRAQVAGIVEKLRAALGVKAPD